MSTREKYFSFVVKTDFEQSHQRFDQCRVVMYLDSENWLKGSIECSKDGITWSQMRVCHMYEAQDEVRFGIYACSPEESSFKAIFTDLAITACAWKAHDGQQPDEE